MHIMHCCSPIKVERWVSRENLRHNRYYTKLQLTAMVAVGGGVTARPTEVTSTAAVLITIGPDGAGPLSEIILLVGDFRRGVLMVELNVSPVGVVLVRTMMSSEEVLEVTSVFGESHRVRLTKGSCGRLDGPGGVVTPSIDINSELDVTSGSDGDISFLVSDMK